MTGGWLTRPAREQPIALAVLGLLLAVAIAVIIFTSSGAGHHAEAPRRAATAPFATTPPAVIGTRPMPSPISAAQRAAAVAAGRHFLASYLPVLYGRASARTIIDADPHVRGELAAASRTPPAPRQRHPRLISLTTHSETASTVVLIAVIDDGVQRPYQIVFQLADDHQRWRVTELANY